MKHKWKIFLVWSFQYTYYSNHVFWPIILYSVSPLLTVWSDNMINIFLLTLKSFWCKKLYVYDRWMDEYNILLNHLVEEPQEQVVGAVRQIHHIGNLPCLHYHHHKTVIVFFLSIFNFFFFNCGVRTSEFNILSSWNSNKPK